MIIHCPACRKKYRFNEDRLQGRLEVRFKCPACNTIFTVKNPFVAEGADTIVRTINPFKTSENTVNSDLQIIDEIETVLDHPQRISLAIIRGDEAGKIYPITKSRTTIGRRGTDIIVHDLEMSRRHAAIELREGNVVLRDLNSTNGTYVNEKPVKEITLENHMEFRVGNTVFMVIVADDEYSYDEG